MERRPNPYSTNRYDPDPATERVVTTPIRQSNSTRVVDVQSQTTPVLASVYSTTATIAGPPDNGTGPVVANWNAETTDTDTMHDTGVNPNRVTVVAGKAGKYRASVRIVFISNGATSNRLVKIRVNGVVVATKTVVALNGSPTAVHLDWEQYLNVGDYYDVLLDATGGAGAALNYNPNAGPDDSWFVVTKQFV